MTTNGAQLRKLIEAPEITVLPGVHDTLSALIAQSCGAKAISAGGYSATASLLGRPDSSQLSLTELGEYYARMTDRIEIPILADGDTGFGNVTNVTRTVRVLERSGVSGFFIEDQVFPKRCGHMAGKAIIGVKEMVSKLKAALDARQGDTMIMARTDAIATDGFQEALDSMALYHEVGVDILFVGPGDLGLRLRDEPELTLAQSWDMVADACRRHGKAFGGPTSSPADNTQRREQGAQMFISVGELRSWANALAAGAAKLDGL